MAEKNRSLYILKYLLDSTIKNYQAMINNILTRADLLGLQSSGFDVICDKSRQNKYCIGTRTLEYAELKTIFDAVQAAKFISPAKSLSLIEKLSSLASPYQAKELKRKLYVKGKAKTSNENRQGVQ